MGKICRVNPLMPGCNKKVTHCLNMCDLFVTTRHQRVKQRTKTHKKGKGFLGVRIDVVNIVNTGIDLSNVNSESIRDILVNSNVNSTILPKSDNEQILNLQKLSASSSK